MGNPRVPTQLQAVIDQAAGAMSLGVPVERLTDAVARVVTLVGLDADDENVAAAISCLEQVALEYQTWMRVTGR
jgi:hypothetical protein